jgi:hypothetical protein
MDIALSGPVFTSQPRSWHEVHPCLRFAEVLRVAASLPSHLRKPDNIDEVQESYYREIENFIRNALQWQPIEYNLADTLVAIRRRIAYGQEMAGPTGSEVRDILGVFYDRRFGYAMDARRRVLSTMLFPWNNRWSRNIGLLTIPPAVWYQNRIDVTRFPGETFYHSWFHLKDVVITSLLGHLINAEPWGPPIFSSVRALFEALPTAFTDSERAQLPIAEATDFESFASQALGRDYRELMGDDVPNLWPDLQTAPT